MFLLITLYLTPVPNCSIVLTHHCKALLPALWIFSSIPYHILRRLFFCLLYLLLRPFATSFCPAMKYQSPSLLWKGAFFLWRHWKAFQAHLLKHANYWHVEICGGIDLGNSSRDQMDVSERRRSADQFYLRHAGYLLAQVPFSPNLCLYLSARGATITLY